MKRTLAVLVLLLCGCSMNHSVVPASSTRPAIVTMSGYTKAGCLENLRTEAAKRGWEIRENDDPVDAGGVVVEVLIFPLAKGVSCSAQIIKGEVPADF